MREVILSVIIIETDLYMANIGNNIKRLRNIHDLSQFDLACLVDCDKGLISEIERGCYKNISIRTLLKFTYVFEIDLIELIK